MSGTARRLLEALSGAEGEADRRLHEMTFRWDCLRESLTEAAEMEDDADADAELESRGAARAFREALRTMDELEQER